MVQLYNLADNFRVDDRALACCDGNLEAESAAFRRPGTHRQSPWYATTLKLHSIESMRARYNDWAAAEFDRIHGGPQGGYIAEDGRMVEHKRPENPYRTPQLTKG